MNRNSSLIFSLILLALLINCFSGCVSSPIVIDGDTIKLQSGDTIRYLGIDTPERGEHLYLEATKLNRELVRGKVIILQPDKTDKDVHGRLLRYVFANDIFVNLELVRHGMALAYTRYKFQDNLYYALFEQACDEAYRNELGIWSLPEIHPKLINRPQDYYIPWR